MNIKEYKERKELVTFYCEFLFVQASDICPNWKIKSDSHLCVKFFRCSFNIEKIQIFSIWILSVTFLARIYYPVLISTHNYTSHKRFIYVILYIISMYAWHMNNINS